MTGHKKLSVKSKQLLLINENERLARRAEKNNDFELAKMHWQLSQQHAKFYARLSAPTKPRGHTKKTLARIEYLRSIKNDQNTQTHEELEALISENKLRKSSRKYWTNKELENDYTILNFIKKYRMQDSYIVLYS